MFVAVFLDVVASVVLGIVVGMVVDNMVEYKDSDKEGTSILVDQNKVLECFLWVFFGCLDCWKMTA